jgi:hypothetical protein
MKSTLVRSGECQTHFYISSWWHAKWVWLLMPTSKIAPKTYRTWRLLYPRQPTPDQKSCWVREWLFWSSWILKKMWNVHRFCAFFKGLIRGFVHEFRIPTCVCRWGIHTMQVITWCWWRQIDKVLSTASSRPYHSRVRWSVLNPKPYTLKRWHVILLTSGFCLLSHALLVSKLRSYYTLNIFK